ncbi:MAG: ComEC family competence protein, partial [Anaeroplasmataceae bacterium]|nr:ComEC family competence protein [Anaeroplasmataceae bacterium]
MNQWKLQELESGEYEGVYEVIDVQTNYFVIKGQTKCIVFEENKDLKPGDVIQAKVHFYKLNQASFEGDFDEKSYYASKGITNRGKILQYEYIKSIWSLERMRYYVLDFYSIHLEEKSFSYLKTLFFGMTDLDKEVKEAYSLLYISHILAISGLHITFFFSFLVLILQKIFHVKGEGIAVLIIGIYVFFIGYPVACLRAFLFLALRVWNKKGSIHYTELDILSVVYIGMVLLFPLKAFQTSFILSFVISFFLLFMKDFNLSKSKINKAFLSSLICLCSILPFLINLTNQISIVGILLSFLLGVILVKCLFPCIVALLFFPISFYEVIFEALDKGLVFISKYT